MTNHSVLVQKRRRRQRAEKVLTSAAKLAKKLRNQKEHPAGTGVPKPA